MPDAASRRGIPLLAQIGACAIGGAILVPALQVPIVVSCFAGLIAATFLREEKPAHVEPLPRRRRPRRPRDDIETASEDSFPASEAPSWTPVTGTRTRH